MYTESGYSPDSSCMGFSLSFRFLFAPVGIASPSPRFLREDKRVDDREAFEDVDEYRLSIRCDNLLPVEKLLSLRDSLLSRRETGAEGPLDTFLRRTVFISFKNAAILSCVTPTVGMPCLRGAYEGFIGASVGIGAGFNDALAEAKSGVPNCCWCSCVERARRWRRRRRWGWWRREGEGRYRICGSSRELGTITY